MNIFNNTFKNNHALLGGGGIFFKNKLLTESPYQCNFFDGNSAEFANDFFTFPMRMKFFDNQSFDSTINKTIFSLSLVPGITKIKLFFEVIDYYGQTIKSLNGGFLNYL